MALLFATLCQYELTAKHARAQLRALRRRLTGAARRAGAPAGAAPPPPTSLVRRALSGSVSMVGALLAETPALPLHTAGKYVAAAYVVLFVLVLVYVAIMAVRLSRIERELGELLELTDATARRTGRRARGGAGRRRARHCPRGGDTGMSELLALGLSHKTAPVALRERLAFTEPGAVALAQRLTAGAEVREAVVLSTCNRTEVYLVVGDPVRRRGAGAGDPGRPRGARLRRSWRGSIYAPRNCDAARQLYRVTAGLESMIVGEAEIQGQVKRAFEAALRAGCTGPLSNRLWSAALSTGKRVRSETAIGSSRVSVPSVGGRASPSRCSATYASATS